MTKEQAQELWEAILKNRTAGMLWIEESALHPQSQDGDVLCREFSDTGKHMQALFIKYTGHEVE